MMVIWSESAIAQCEAIRDYFSRSSPAYVASILEKIVRRTESLKDNPLVGAEVPEYGDPAIREVYEHPYRILYRVVGQDIRIIGVVHSSRRLPRTPNA